ncbi:hypothetical protein, partial [Serratia marcescens]|uniref:hypothetical protein n=1 Tax=Serratia marcescens TaxID=615 RepID=UPI0025812A2A
VVLFIAVHYFISYFLYHACFFIFIKTLPVIIGCFLISLKYILLRLFCEYGNNGAMVCLSLLP